MLKLKLKVGVLLLLFFLTGCSEESLVGQPLKQEGDHSAIYRLMADHRLRHMDSWATFQALGYQPEDIETLSEAEFVAYDLAPPLTLWLVGLDSEQIYQLQAGKRYLVPDLETFLAMGGDFRELSLVSPEFLARFPLAEEPLPSLRRSPDQQNHPQVTAALWADGFLWVANGTGLLTRWDVAAGQYQEYHLPVVRSLATDGTFLYIGTETGEIWHSELKSESSPQRLTDTLGWISALIFDSQSRLWAADINHWDRQYRWGQGLVQWQADHSIRSVSVRGESFPPDAYPLRHITVLAFDTSTEMLWIGTRFAGLLRYHPQTNSWDHYTTFNSELAANRINDLKIGPDNTIWLATPMGVSRYDGENQVWENHRLAEGISEKGALSLALAADGETIWVAGDQYLARFSPDQSWQLYPALEQPLLADRFQFVVLDDADHPWFLGRFRKIYFDGQSWRAYAVDVRQSTEFNPVPPVRINPDLEPPLEFPSPTEDYMAWLQSWPRPENDNGLGMHFVQRHWLDEIEAQKQINRLKKLNIRWTLVTYANHYQLRRLAPLFAEAGITVIWRPFVRPYESYDHWAEDVEFLRSRGLPPYMQLYNEPSLAQEWDETHPIDQDIYWQHLLPAIRQVYDAGGYIGLQFLDPDWLQQSLNRLKEENMAYSFDRLFFIPHLYGLNHPPDYDEDINAVLGFRYFADIFEAEIGFVPMMIAGEGGWRPGEAQDNRYPPIDEIKHREYHLAVFNWFRTGELSDGTPLPDYLFAFCPWLLSDPHDPAAWFDSTSGDRTLTIQAIEQMPVFERKFSWQK